MLIGAVEDYNLTECNAAYPPTQRPWCLPDRLGKSPCPGTRQPRPGCLTAEKGLATPRPRTCWATGKWLCLKETKFLPVIKGRHGYHYSHQHWRRQRA